MSVIKKLLSSKSNCNCKFEVLYIGNVQINSFQDIGPIEQRVSLLRMQHQQRKVNTQCVDS